MSVDSKHDGANLVNLGRMADLIEKVPQEMFNMHQYRLSYDLEDTKCNSVGCIIGHCTVLDQGNILVNYKFVNEDIHFTEWSWCFTNLHPSSGDWRFLFAELWEFTDNTPVGAAKRIRYYIQNGLPENWFRIMNGWDPLPY